MAQSSFIVNNAMKTKSVIKTILKALGMIFCAALAIILIFTLTLEIYKQSIKGDYTLIAGDTQKSFSVEFTEVKTYPKNSSEGRAWRDGMIGGNGKLGFVNAGAPYNDTIIFQDVDYIMPSSRDRFYLPDLYKDVDSARQAIVNLDDNFEASGCGDWNYGYAFHPGQQLRITQNKQTFFKDYIRWTDFETGEVGVSYRDKGGTWVRKTFTSRTDNVTITSIQKSNTGSKFISL